MGKEKKYVVSVMDFTLGIGFTQEVKATSKLEAVSLVLGITVDSLDIPGKLINVTTI